jgi:general secretion pathway protein A
VTELAVAPAVPAAAEDAITAPPAAEPAVSPQPTAVLAEVLTTNRAITNTDNAFATLFGLWGLDYTHGNASACQQARNHGLYCLFQRGSLSQVKNMNHPVILTLRDQDSQQHQVVLSGLKDGIASLAVADAVYEVGAAELGDYWFGEYLLLWKPQIDEVKQFVPGMRDDDVRWLRQSLAEIQGEPVPPMDSDLFDQDLEARVRDYQRQRRLTIDGLVGYQTQIAINSDLSTLPGPRLVWAN